jgi:hypothetical protein
VQPCQTHLGHARRHHPFFCLPHAAKLRRPFHPFEQIFTTANACFVDASSLGVQVRRIRRILQS